MSRFQKGFYINLDNATLGQLDVAKADADYSRPTQEHGPVTHTPVGMQLDIIKQSIPAKYEVTGSVAGSVQNMIVDMERVMKDSLRYNWIVEEGGDRIEGILVRGTSREDIDTTIDREMFLDGYDV